MTDPTPRPSAEGAARPLPCPFCGQTPKAVRRLAGWRIACQNDDCSTMPNGFVYPEREVAVAVWNAPLRRRADMATLLAFEVGREDAGELNGRERAALTAARGLVAKMDMVHDSDDYRAVWEIAQLHRGPYAGMTYTAELAALREALAAADELLKGEG